MKLKRINIFICILAAMMAFVACSEGNTEPKIEYEYVDKEVILNIVEAPMFVGDTLNLSITTKYIEEDTEFLWSSSKNGVASVEADETTRAAVVTAKSAGTATINVRIGGRTKARCTITVSAVPTRLSFSLPGDKLILQETGDRASIRVAIDDQTIQANTISWRSEDTDVATVTASGQLAYITAVAEGETNIVVSGQSEGETVEAKLFVKVLLTTESPEEASSRTYNVYSSSNQKSPTVYKGLSSALNELMYGAQYKNDSYLTYEGETDKLFTFAGKNYNFFTRSNVYKGFDALSANVENGQANYWAGWLSALNIYNREGVNMLQYNGGFAKSWYYRSTKHIYTPNQDVNNADNGYQAAVYQAAGAGLNYSTWGDDRSYWLKEIQLNYDLSGSHMTPSKSNKGVFAEIYIRPIITGVGVDSFNYYGAYFDAGTEQETDALADGTTRNWHPYKGRMAYSVSDKRVYPLASQLEIDESTVLGTSTWNKAQGRWESTDLTLSLTLNYKFSDENGGNNFAIEYKIDSKQGEAVASKTYTDNYGKVINRNQAAIRLTYGASFTPKAALQTGSEGLTNVVDLAAAGFYKFDEVPDIHNGATWLNLRQGACTGTGEIGTAVREGEVAGTPVNSDLSVKGSGTRQYVSIWGSDVLSQTSVSEFTVLNWHF